MPDAYLHVIEGPLRGQSFPLSTHETRLGRGDDSGINLSDYTQVSRNHARLYKDGSALIVEDLGSTNGVFVNGQRVSNSQLQDGAILKLGDFVARLSMPGSSSSGPPPTQYAPSVPPPTQFAPPAPPLNYPPPVPYPDQSPATTGQSTGLASVSNVLGIIAMSMMFMGLFPCLGWINWMAIPLGVGGGITGLIAVLNDQRPETRNQATIGLVMSLMAVCIGGVRLLLGGGIC